MPARQEIFAAMLGTPGMCWSEEHDAQPVRLSGTRDDKPIVAEVEPVAEETICVLCVQPITPDQDVLLYSRLNPDESTVVHALCAQSDLGRRLALFNRTGGRHSMNAIIGRRRR